MKVLHLLASGGTGGIEVLCKNIALNSNMDNRWVFLFNEGEMYEELIANSIQVLSVVKENFLDKIKKINSYCKEEQIDIIVMHHGGLNCNIIYCLLKKYNAKVKFIRYMHACYDKYSFGNSSNKLKNLIVKNQMKKAINISDGIIYISEASKQSFNNNFKIKTKEVVIYNGIDSKFFTTPKTTPKNDEVINIIYIGRLDKVKGVNLLIEAFKKLRIKFNNIRLTIVGDGIERKKLEEQAEELMIVDSVKFTGKRSNVIELLDKSNIFVYPSIWEEGFGISVVEAMSRGCIPVTFKKGGLKEIIEDEKNGFLVEDVNADSLAETIEKAINLPDKNSIMDNAVKSSKKYTLENTIKNLKFEFDKVLNIES